jgi:hypothetical protein
MITQQMHAQLEGGQLSWSRAKEIIQKALKAPAGHEKKTLDREMAEPAARRFRPLNFRSVIGHFSKVVRTKPQTMLTLEVEDLYALVLLLRGKDFGQDHIERVRKLFPEIIARQR